MRRSINKIIYLLIVCICLCACSTKKDTLTDYAISEAVRYCYDYAGYDLDNNYQLVEESDTEEFRKTYYVLENDKPLIFLRINYSDEPFYGGFVHEYKDGYIAIDKYGFVDSSVTYDINTAMSLNDYLLKEENVDVELAPYEDRETVDIKDLIDLDYFEISYEDLDLEEVSNYYVTLLDCPSFIDGNRKTLRIIEDYYNNYLIYSNDKCVGTVKYDTNEKLIIEQNKQDTSNCKYIITSNGVSNVYYLTKDRQLDEIELNKYERVSNSVLKAYDYLNIK